MFHFPRTKFVDENGAFKQLQHLSSEVDELVAAFHTPDVVHTLKEAFDVIHSAETFIRIFSDHYDVDLEEIKASVIDGNRSRGYYAE